MHGDGPGSHNTNVGRPEVTLAKCRVPPADGFHADGTGRQMTTALANCGPWAEGKKQRGGRLRIAATEPEPPRRAVFAITWSPQMGFWCD